MIGIIRKTALAAALGTTVLAAPAHAQSEQPQVMLIMDSSGSMKRRIGGEPKMAVAKRSVADFLAGAPSEVPLGLMAYGHRRSRDCSDIEIMIPPSAGTGRAIRAAVDAMVPRGETPIAESIRQAAAYMDSGSRPTTIVLVTDGEEACNADPCAAARELESAGVEFTAHVIGFGLNEAQSQAVKCLADETGGQFIAANDAPQLAAALKKVVPPPPAPEPEPVKKASAEAYWEDHFEGEGLSESWTVLNENPNDYLVDGSELILVNGNSNYGPRRKGTPNTLIGNVDLPRGDWDLSVQGRFEFTSGKDAFVMGLGDDAGNGVFAVLNSDVTGRGYWSTLSTRQHQAFAEKGQAKINYFSPDRGNAEHKLGPAGKDFARRTTTLTLHKRGRKYYTSVDNGPYGATAETDTLTVLRAPKTISLFAWKWAGASGDTVINIDRIWVSQVE